MRVRPARPEDAAAHVRTWQAAYEHVFGAERLAALDTPERRGRWQRRLTDGERVWVAEADDGRVVGFAWIGDSRDDEDKGELYAIYVLPETWGSGAGSALMAAALAALRASYATAILWVLEDNPRARRFYEREGWRLDGARKTGELLGLAVPEVRYRITL